jgi:hypothetical protein
VAAKRARLTDFAAVKPAPAQDQPDQAAEQDVPRRGMTLRLRPDAWRALKYAAIERGVPAHDVLIEALNAWFTAHGIPPIA